MRSGGAHSRVAVAIRRGLLVRPETCERCGRGGKIEAHHKDYSRPLDVQWLCKPCHWRADVARVLPADAAQSVRIRRELLDELRALAQRNDRPLVGELRIAIREHLRRAAGAKR